MTRPEAGWEAGARLEDFPAASRARYEQVAARLGRRALVLDAGCGQGYGTSILSEQAQRVIGCDIRAESIAFANRYWKNDRTVFSIQDLHQLRFEPGQTFDGVAIVDTLQCLAVPELFLLALRAHITPETQVFIATPNQAALPHAVSAFPHHFRHYTIAELRDLLRAVGYEIGEVSSQHGEAWGADERGQYLLVRCAMGSEQPELCAGELEPRLAARLHEHLLAAADEMVRLAELAGRKEASDLLVQKRQRELDDLREKYRALLAEARMAQYNLRAMEQRAGDLRQIASNVEQVTAYLAQMSFFSRNSQKLLRLPVRLLRRLRGRPEGPGGGGEALAGPPRTVPAGGPPDAALVGKRANPEDELTERGESYVRGFCSLVNVYGQSSKSGSARLIIDVSRICGDHLTGVGYYCEQLTRALLRRSPHRLEMFSARGLPQWMLDYPGEPGFLHCPRAYRWYDYNAPEKAPRLEEIVGPYSGYFHTSADSKPFFQADNQISVVYDLAPISCPETVVEAVTRSCIEYTRYLAAHSRAFIAISEYTKSELVDFAKLDPEVVHVVPVALDPVFRQPMTEADLARVRSKYGLDTPYLLCVGTLQPRKNLRRLLEAYDLLKRQGEKLPRLVLTGSDRWQDVGDDWLRALDIEQDVVWTGYVDRLDMPALYGMSEVFVYPSYFEGYGMPVAEAMACGAAVVCGDRTSLPEVGGEAAVYFDPHSTESLCEALRGVLHDPARIQELRQRSSEHAQSYLSWQDVADRFLEIYQRIT